MKLGISPAHNSTYKKLAVQCSVDTFVINQTLVLRINICGENRRLRQARNRYVPPKIESILKLRDDVT